MTDYFSHGSHIDKIFVPNERYKWSESLKKLKRFENITMQYYYNTLKPVFKLFLTLSSYLPLAQIAEKVNHCPTKTTLLMSKAIVYAEICYQKLTC